MRDSLGTRARSGLSTVGRVVFAMTLLIAFSILGRAAIDIFGFPLLNYKGRGNLIFAQMSTTLEISIADKRRAMALWFNRNEEDARWLAFLLRGPLASSARSGFDDKWKSSISGLFAAGLARNPAYSEVFLADASTGKVIISSAAHPVAESLEPRRFDETNAAFLLASSLVYLLPLDSTLAGSGDLWLGFVIDPARFFRSIVPAGQADAAGLDWALVDGDWKVLATNEPRLYGAASPVLPAATRSVLLSRKVEEVSDSRGIKVLARLSSPLPMIAGGVRLYVAANRSLLDAPLGAETLASILLNVFFGLASIAVTWFVLSFVFRPYHELAEALRTYAKGGVAHLPRQSRGEIGYLVGAFGDLLARVSAQRQNLEKEVESRTSDLSIINAVTRAMALVTSDDWAYESSLAVLRDGLGVEAGLFVYFDGKNEARAVFSEGRQPLALEPSMVAEVERASKSVGDGVTVLDERYEGCVGMRLAFEGEAVGYVLIGRRGASFHAREVEAVTRVLKDLAPLVYERRERSRREATKAAAENELRRSEERLRTFFEESRDMIYTANADDTIAWINDAGVALLGLSDRFGAVGRKFSDFALSPEDRVNFIEELRLRGYARDYEIVLRKADGGPMFCIETTHCMRRADGSVQEIQGIVKDISERINKEKELWRANLELNAANARLRETQMLIVQREKLASIGQLSAGVAHEINNPLGFLKSNHEVLRGFLGKLETAWDQASALDPVSHGEIAKRLDLDYVFDQVSEIVRESDDGYRRIVEIVKTLRNFAREDSDASFADYDIEEGIKSTLIVARNETKYVAEVEQRLGGVPHLMAAGGEINQVLLNIVMNAAQAIEGQKRQDKGRIAITTFTEGDQLVVSIEDDGPGIPEALKLRIFDPFFTTKEPGKGTGLGLSISYDIIVSKHGGKLIVGDSSLGGASFRIELPIHGTARAPSGPDGDEAPAERADS